MTVQAQSFFNRMLLRYPKIDTPEIISAGWTFDQTLTRKSTTVSYTTPSEDTSEDILVYRDKNNNIIGSISFTQYADGNVGVNFKLGEHTYTIRISDEGHIDLRSSYPLCGFISGTDEVATAEYVIDCSKANDELLENSLKEFINSSLSDLETSLKDYIDNKDADRKDYIDNKYADLLDEIHRSEARMQLWVKNYVPTYVENNTINYIYNAKFGPWETIVGTDGGIGDEWTWSSGARNGLLMFRVRGHVNNDLYINDTKKSRLYDGDGQGRRTVLLTIPVKSQTKYRITGSVYGPIYFAPLMLERSES